MGNQMSTHNTTLGHSLTLCKPKPELGRPLPQVLTFHLKAKSSGRNLSPSLLPSAFGTPRLRVVWLPGLHAIGRHDAKGSGCASGEGFGALSAFPPSGTSLADLEEIHAFGRGNQVNYLLDHT